MISSRKEIKRYGLQLLFMIFLLGYLVAPSFGEEQFLLKAHEANYKVDIKGFTAELKTSLKTSDGVVFFAEDFIKTTGIASVF